MGRAIGSVKTPPVSFHRSEAEIAIDGWMNDVVRCRCVSFLMILRSLGLATLNNAFSFRASWIFEHIRSMMFLHIGL
jgi:hypothetical protein